MYSKGFYGGHCNGISEKLIWGQFLPIVFAGAYYAWDLSRGGQAARAWPLFGVLLVFVLAQVIYLIVVAALSRPEPDDERTRLIALKAYKVAYLTGTAALCLWLAASLFHLQSLSLHAATPLFAVVVWFGVEAVRTGTQLALYRLGARA